MQFVKPVTQKVESDVTADRVIKAGRVDDKFRTIPVHVMKFRDRCRLALAATFYDCEA